MKKHANAVMRMSLFRYIRFSPVRRSGMRSQACRKMSRYRSNRLKNAQESWNGRVRVSPKCRKPAPTPPASHTDTDTGTRHGRRN